MTLELFQRAVLTEDLPAEGLCVGDVGMIVDYAAKDDVAEGYELEFFTAGGQTVAVVSVPATAVYATQADEILSARRLARA